MNAEELHEIARELRAEIDRTQVIVLLTALEGALTNQVSSPAHPDYQTAVAQARAALAQGLGAGWAANFPPRWTEFMDEHGLEILRADGLIPAVERILVEQALTPQSALNEITALRQRVITSSDNLQALVDALSYFGIETYELSANEFEADVLMPRAWIRGDFGLLASEFTKLNRILAPFQELGTGGRPPVRVRAIASSDFMTYLELAPEVARLLSMTIVQLLEAYERVRQIRKSRTDLETAGVSAETLLQVQREADTHMEKVTGRVVQDLLREAAHSPEATRVTEITAELTNSVEMLAYRIDHSYRITVRTGIAEAALDDEAVPNVELSRARTEVLANQSRLKYQELEGEPILALPLGDLEEDQAAERPRS
jgi:hypothetical protein